MPKKKKVAIELSLREHALLCEHMKLTGASTAGQALRRALREQHWTDEYRRDGYKIKAVKKGEETISIPKTVVAYSK